MLCVLSKRCQLIRRSHPSQDDQTSGFQALDDLVMVLGADNPLSSVLLRKTSAADRSHFLNRPAIRAANAGWWSLSGSNR